MLQAQNTTYISTPWYCTAIFLVLSQENVDIVILTQFSEIAATGVKTYLGLLLELCAKNRAVEPLNSVPVHAAFTNPMTCFEWAAVRLIIIIIRGLLRIERWHIGCNLGFWGLLFLCVSKDIRAFVLIACSVALEK